MSALREKNDKGEVSYHWVNSFQQSADVLTKRGASKWKLFDVLGQACLGNQQLSTINRRVDQERCIKEKAL